MKSCFSAGRPAEWIETFEGVPAKTTRGVSPLEDQRSGLKPGEGRCGALHWDVSPLEDQRSGLKHRWPDDSSASAERFSAGRPAEWIETRHTRSAATHRHDVSPLEDQRSGLKHRRTVDSLTPSTFLRWKTSGVD